MTEVSKGREETTRERIERWLSIAADRAEGDLSYRVYPSDWAMLAAVLRLALKEMP